MPRQQLMIEQANIYFQYDKLKNPSTRPDPKDFPEGVPLGTVLTNVGIAKTAQDVQVANGMPTGLAESLKAMIRTNLLRDEPYSIQFLWWPAFDWDVDCCEIGPLPVPGSIGGISVLIKSKPDPLTP